MSPREDSTDDDPRCVLCRHFFVTWQAPLGRGCRAYEFRSEEFPSVVVRASSGLPCQLFEPKQSEASSS